MGNFTQRFNWPAPPKKRRSSKTSFGRGSRWGRKLTAKPKPAVRSSRGSVSRGAVSRRMAGTLSASPAVAPEQTTESPGMAPPSAPAPPASSASAYSPEQEAKDILEQQYGPKIAALLRSRDVARDEHSALTGATQKYGATFDSKLGEIYDKLRQQLQQSYGTTASSFTQAEGQIRGAYDATGKAVQKATGEAGGELTGTANKLGLEAGLAPVQDRLKEFLTLAQTQTEQNKAGSLANLAAHKTGALTHAQGGIADAAREGAGARTELARSVVGQLGQLNLHKLRTETDIQKELTSLESEKAAALREMIQKIKESREEAEREAAKEEFARRIQQNTMDIQLAKLGLARDKQEFDQGMDVSKLGLETSRFGALEEDRATKNALAMERLGLTTRGQDLAHSRGVESLQLQREKAGLSPGKPKPPGKKTEAEARRDAQAFVLRKIRTSASKGTRDAFKRAIAAPTYAQALRNINDTPDKEFKKRGISKSRLIDWVRRYYNPTPAEFRRASGKR